MDAAGPGFMEEIEYMFVNGVLKSEKQKFRRIPVSVVERKKPLKSLSANSHILKLDHTYLGQHMASLPDL